MADRARVQSIDALRDFRAALIKFADEVREALVDSDAEISRARTWVNSELKSGWSGRLRKSQEQVTQAKAAVQRKQVYAASKDSAPSAVDEKKALEQAKRRVEISQEKLRNVSRWSRGLEKESQMCRGQTQVLARTVEIEIPKAIALLDRLMERLHEYLEEAPVETRASKMAQYWRGTILDAEADVAPPLASEEPGDDKPAETDTGETGGDGDTEQKEADR